MTTCIHGKEPDTLKAATPLAGTKAPTNHDLVGKQEPRESQRGPQSRPRIPVPSNL